MIYHARSFRALLLASCMAAGAAPAFADEAATSPADASGGGDEIVVTAQKRDERLVDVPIPVSVVSAKTLMQENDAQLRDYFTKLPGLAVYSAGNGRSTFVVRGITTGSGNNPTVALVLDDVPLGSSTGAGLGDQVSAEIDPSDVSQVEVLRGPQGTLYGASSLGGLIKYVSVMPDTTRYSGSVSVNGEAIEHGGLGWATRGSVNVPITDTLAVRASGYFRRDAGWVDDATSGDKDVNNTHAFGGKITALWKPTSDLTVLATALLQNRKSYNVSDMDVDINRVPLYGNYEHSRVPGTGLGDKKVRLYSLRAAYDMGFATLTSITSYSRINFVGPQDVSQTFIPLLKMYGIVSDTTGLGAIIANNAYSRKWTQEVRLSSNGKGPLQWQVGGFFTHEKNNTDQTIYAVDAATGAPYDLYGYTPIDTAQDPDTYREFAAYGDVTYNFTDKLALQLGGRYAMNRQSDIETLGGILGGDEDGNPVTSSMKSKDHAFTFLVSPTYHINDNLMAYVRVASGYRPGGPNIVPVTSAFRSYNPDRTVNYDLGLKGQVAPGLLSVDLSVFDIEWNKIQLSQTDASSGLSYTGNGGKARSRGVEASATLTPWQGMTATGNLTYTDADLREDVAVTTLYAAKGDRLPYSAKWAGSIDLEQRFVLPGEVQAYVGGTMAYVGDRYSDFARSATQQRFEMPAFTTYSLRAGVESNGWTYSLYVRNLTDKLGFVSGSARNTLTRSGTFAAGVIQPRTIGLSIGKDF